MKVTNYINPKYLIIFILFVILASNGEDYSVTAEKLVIRSGAGTEFVKTGGLSKNDKVTVLEINNGWARIKTTDSIGYVSLQYIEKISETTNSTSSKSESTSNFMLFIIVVIIIYLFFRIIYALYYRKCNKCGKWASMSVINKELVDQKKSKVKKIEKTKNKKGEVIRTKEVYVPATTYIYDLHRKCKNCGYEDVVQQTKTKVN